MKNVIRNNEMLWKGIFSIVLGVIMVAWPGLTTRTIVIIMGVTLLVTALVLFIGYFRRKSAGNPVRIPLAACISLLLGLCLVIMPQFFVNMLVIVFGILLVLGGIDQIASLAIARRAGVAVPVFFFLAPVMVLIVGFYIMFSPAISSQGFMILFGITAIIFGIIALYDEYLINRSVKTVKAIEVDEEESV